MPELYSSVPVNYAWDNLIGGGKQPITDGAIVASGAGLVLRGTLLGKITASGKFTPYTAGAVDGSNVPTAICGKDCEATASDGKTFIYLAGIFNSAALIGYTAALRDPLRDAGIFIGLNVGQNGVSV